MATSANKNFLIQQQFVKENIKQKTCHYVLNDHCSFNYPHSPYDRTMLKGECCGKYTHKICKDSKCSLGCDHYDHNKKIHYYHLCYYHSPKDAHNGICPDNCPLRDLMNITINGVCQSNTKISINNIST